MISRAKLIGLGLAALAIIAIITLGYRHYTGLVEENKALSVEIAVKNETILSQEATNKRAIATIGEWKESQDKLANSFNELAEAVKDARKETNRLSLIFRKHDLEKLALRKPGLIENRINSGTSNINRLLECATEAGRNDCPSGD